MEEMSFRLGGFDGPLDLLLTLIQKNKMNIQDIEIAVICEQYLAFIEEAQENKMDIAGEFIVMASELLLIKSKILLLRETEKDKEDDPRKELADALLRYQQAKEATQKMIPLFRKFSGRMVKDTDEISADKTFVEDQDVTSLALAVRRIIAANESRPKAEKQVFAPLVAKPIVSVDVKIVGILHHMEKQRATSMKALLQDATSLNDMIAIFLGILELVKVQKIVIDEDETNFRTIHGIDTAFIVNDQPVDNNKPPKDWSREKTPIPLSSKAELHREQRRIIREQKLAEKKRLRAEERKRRQEEKKAAQMQGQSNLFDVPADDSDLEREAKVAELMDEQLSEAEDDIMDDLGLDYNQLVEDIAKAAGHLPDNDNENKR